MTIISVTHEYSGFSDFWGGNGRRWDNDAGCLFAHYVAGTTLHDCVDQWVEDFNGGGDCDSFPDEITSDDIRAAILDYLTEQGRADYKSGALAECAVKYAEANDFDKCQECGKSLGDRHEFNCGKAAIRCPDVVQDDCNEDEDDYESPIWVILVEIEVCDDCGAAVDTDGDNLCVDCADVIENTTDLA